MADDIHVNLAQLASAVHGSDNYPFAVRRHLLDQLVQLVAKRLAMACLGDRRVHLDIGNGLELQVQVQPLTDPFGATHGAPTSAAANPLGLPNIEAVAAEVHEAWMASKQAQGISSRCSESGEEMMVPYTQLSEPLKELDRATVRAVFAAIKAAGAAAGVPS